MKQTIKKRRKKKTLGSYPYISVIFSITLTLFVFGLFSLLILYSNNLKDTIRNNVTMQIFLDKFITENEKIKINRLLSQKVYVARENGKADIVFISKEEAAKDFIKQSGEDFIEFLGDNPLRDAYAITIAPSYQVVDSLENIKNEIDLIDGVFEVVYVESLVQEINKNIAIVSIILVVFAIILLITIVVIMNNTIKLALFSQRFLIRSMQLVGARTGFIITPFLKRAFFHGLLSGIIASGLLYALVNYLLNTLSELRQLHNEKELVILFAGIICTGVIIGIGSTWVTVKKYLHMSLDELY